MHFDYYIAASTDFILLDEATFASILQVCTLLTNFVYSAYEFFEVLKLIA